MMNEKGSFLRVRYLNKNRNDRFLYKNFAVWSFIA
jgi:hypothetical protein